MSTRGVPKEVQKVDCLGNKLWLPDGKPKITIIYVEEPASANVQYQHVPQQIFQQIPQTPVPNLYGGQTYSLPPKPVVPQQDTPFGGGNRYNQGNQNGNQGRGRGGNGGNRGNRNRGSVNNGPPKKCQLCGGKHQSLIFCKELTESVPYGTGFLEAPKNLYTCLSTEFPDSKSCDHSSDRYCRNQYCDRGNRCYILCKSCPNHLPCHEYFKHNNKSDLGYRNFSSKRNELGPDVIKACTCAV